MDMQHNILFLVSLPEYIVRGMESDGYSYSESINTIKANANVELRESITSKDLKDAGNYDITIIVAHHDDNNDALVLADGKLLPISELVASFREGPDGFDKILDLAVCNSSDIARRIKQRCKNCKIMAAGDETGAETRLHIYPKLFEFIAKHPDVSYPESYLHVLRQEKEKQENKEKTIQLIETKKLGTMSTSAAPPRVCRNSPFPVKVYIHADADELDINAEIGDYRRNIKRNLKLKNGDPISWNLSFNTDPKPYEDINKHILGAGLHSEIWNSEKPRIDYTFDCFLEPEFCLNGFNGVLKTAIGDKDPETWLFSFNVEVVPHNKDSNKDNTERERQSIEKNEDKTNKVDDVRISALLSQLLNKKEVDVSFSKIEAYFKNKDLKEHIDNQIKEVGKISAEMSLMLQQDYIIIKNRLISNGEENLIQFKKNIYKLDKRQEMLNELVDIRKFLAPLPGNVERLRERAQDFFSCLFVDKIDIEVFNVLLKEIYSKNDGSEVLWISGNLTHAFTGLAIVLAKPDIKFELMHKHFVISSRPPKNPQARVRPEITEESRREQIKKAAINFIINFQKDNIIKEVLDRYLDTKEGKSSVFAYYLREVCRHREMH